MQDRSGRDGLRAVAVVPVILFHADFAGFEGGFVGGDVFLVISGYLIAGILIGDLASGRFSIARFHERRARRLLPALFVVMAACLSFVWLWMLPSQMKEFGQSIVVPLLFCRTSSSGGRMTVFLPRQSCSRCCRGGTCLSKNSFI